MHAYRTHTCGALRSADAGQRRPALRLGPPQARPWQSAVHRPARPLRHHPVRARRLLAAVQGGRADPSRKRRHRHRQGGAAHGRDRQPQAADRRDRAADPGLTVQSAAEVLPLQVNSDEDAGEDMRLRYRFLDLRREKVHANIVLRSQRHRLDPPPHDRRRLHRVPDADPDRVLAGRRARLPGAGAPASRQVLRAAAGAAAVQAAADGRRLRPLFPDRALLPRRGQPRRPLAGRVLPARFRDDLRDPGRRVRRHRAGAARRVRGVRRRRARCRRCRSRASRSNSRC